MKASPAQQKELLRVQEADNRLTRIDHSLANLPQDKRIAELQPAADAVRRRLAEVVGELEDAQAEQKRIESDVTVVEQRLARDKDRLQQVSSMKDVEALEAEIASLERRRSDLEDAELEAMERGDVASARLTMVQGELAEAHEEIDRLKAEREIEIARLQQQRSDAEADRMVLRQGVDEELLAVYERQRSRYGVGAAAVRGAVNLGSNMTLAPNDLATVRSAAPDDVIIDSESGAILVRDENS